MAVFVECAHVFVDKSKARGYCIAAAVASTDVNDADRALCRLARPGQRRIHVKSESDSSRRELLAKIAALDVQVQLP